MLSASDGEKGEGQCIALCWWSPGVVLDPTDGPFENFPVRALSSACSADIVRAILVVD
jgi:hypothetical protein